MKRILLTQNIHALIDDEDYSLVNQYKWHALCGGRRWDVRTGPDKKTGDKVLRMHRLIMDAQPGQEVDHKEYYEDYIDNRRSNLRLCTHAENHYNLRKQLTYVGKKTSSQYKGVTWDKHIGKWRAQIIVNGRNICLRYCHDEVEAAQAYDTVAIQYFGEFAKLNNV